jgi:hypothetical protein
MVLECPSVGSINVFEHAPCDGAKCFWWDGRCTARDTVPLGAVGKRLDCPLAGRCRWAREATDGVCPPMTHGTLCQHQGGTFNTFDFEE